ncbi:hypothetical protein M1B72_09360 [Geomonas paludis]|uniref:Lipoprotein n=1 Tax=Geomonas paludis TaxID=2740185 RepID=A0A6V8MUL8_9BACT|nr:hypothetical protein [Geomonas paludis]UPU37897.1 hypothetical protein M1B72_09360 [Geomonas paludis]GFO63584.1 lipoprotein [Geomonas paludis]
MKKYALIAVVILIGAAIAFGVANKDAGKSLNVNDIGPDPSAFTGTITITGINAGVSPYDNSVIGIMDVKELQCKSANCNRIYIPVKYPEQQPKVGDEIKATGAFHKFPTGYMFIAQKLKVVKNHKIGG